MKKLAAAVAGLALIAGCGQSTGDEIDGTDIQPVYVEVEGYRYLCLYTYRDGGYDGGPAMWCENEGLPRSER